MANENPDILGFIEAHANIIAAAIILITFVMGLCLFNMRVDEGGDDSTYITRAMDLVANGTYPTYQGPLYPMFLALFISLFGAKVWVLKLTSLALIVLSQWTFFRMLRGQINIRITFAVMFLMGINSWYLFFGSMTYSEAFYIVIQYIFLGLLLRFENRSYQSTLQGILHSLPSAALVIALYLIRTVGFGFGIIGVVYLCLRKQFVKAALFTGSMLLVFFAWMTVRTAVWGDIKSDTRQIESLMQVHPYQVEDGQETISGYCGRVIDNSNLYVSKHLMRILGLRKAEDRNTNPLVTLLVYALFIFGTVKAWERNRGVLLMALTSIVMLGITFVVLQALWDQVRLIIPYVPIALVVIFYGLYHFFKIFAGKKAHLISMVVVILCSLLTISQSFGKMNADVLKHNLSGDMLYGYTPDWYNYLSVCSVVYDQIPDTSNVACRKPNMARIYSGGHKFFGIYNFNTEDPDELIDSLRDKSVTHMIVASLRRDPLIPGGEVINTIHRYMHFIVKKYPEAFHLCGSCGSENNEPTYLFEVNYNYVDAMRAKLSQSAEEGKANE